VIYDLLKFVLNFVQNEMGWRVTYLGTKFEITEPSLSPSQPELPRVINLTIYFSKCGGWSGISHFNLPLRNYPSKNKK
jgi:hypothetical protein